MKILVQASTQEKNATKSRKNEKKNSKNHNLKKFKMLCGIIFSLLKTRPETIVGYLWKFKKELTSAN